MYGLLVEHVTVKISYARIMSDQLFPFNFKTPNSLEGNSDCSKWKQTLIDIGVWLESIHSKQEVNFASTLACKKTKKSQKRVNETINFKN
jgi:hypothetical protein